MRLVIFTLIISLFTIATLNAQNRSRQANEGTRTPTNTTRSTTTAPRTATRTEMNNMPSVSGGDDDIFTVVDVMPEFPGGQSGLMGYLGSITYPDDALDNNWQGKVYLSFVIEKDGTISDVLVSRSSGYDVLDKAAVYHIETMPPWKPGKQNGKAVRVRYTIPMVFKLG